MKRLMLIKSADATYTVNDAGALITWLEKGYGYARKAQKKNERRITLTHNGCVVSISRFGSVTLSGRNTAQAEQLLDQHLLGNVERQALLFEERL